jgi:hypothetical protein
VRSYWASVLADRRASLRLELPKTRGFQPLRPLSGVIIKLKRGAKISALFLEGQAQETYLLKGHKAAEMLEGTLEQGATAGTPLENTLTLRGVLPGTVLGAQESFRPAPAGAVIDGRPEARSKRYMRAALRRHTASSAIWPLSRSWDGEDVRPLRSKGLAQNRKLRVRALRKHLLAGADYWSRYRGKSYKFFRVLESQSRLSWGSAASNLHYEASGGEY